MKAIYEEVKILIVEDDAACREMYRKMLQQYPSFRIVAEVSTQKEAEAILQEKDNHIDAMILDLELPDGSGVLLLDEMVYMDIVRPFVLVITNVVSHTIYNTIRALGADYICSKKGGMQNLSVPFSIIEINHASRKECIEGSESMFPTNERTKEMIYGKALDLELRRLSVPMDQVSGKALKQAILLTMLCKEDPFQITNHVYPIIAKNRGVSSKAVERNIRNAIERIWTEENTHQIAKMYENSWKSKTGRPTNAEFIIYIANKIIGNNRLF